MPPPVKKEDTALVAKLCANIRAARERAGMSQEKLAELANLSPRALQKIETGVNLQAATLIRIQMALGCPWSELMPKSK